MSDERLILDVGLRQPSEDGEVVRGRLVGLLDHPEHRMLACLRVPRNGLWWAKWDDCWSGPDDPEGFDDHWFEVAGRKPAPTFPLAERHTIGSWVEVIAARGFGFAPWGLRRLPARKVEMRFVRMEREPEMAKLENTPLYEWRMAFPEDPDLEDWATKKLTTSLTHGGPWLLGVRGWVLVWDCSRGEPSCCSVLMDIQDGTDSGWVELRQIGSGADDGWELGPWLEVSTAEVALAPSHPRGA